MVVYLAGGMKSVWQDQVISALPAVTFLDPRSHSIRDEAAYTAWDLAGIAKADIVFAYMDTENPSGFGLSLEVGYAYALGKKIVYVGEDTTDRQRYFGMVRACATKSFSILLAAIRWLKEEVANES